MMDSIREHCFTIATGGSLGESSLGPFLVTLGAFPLLGIQHIISWVSPLGGHVFFFGMLLLGGIIIALALGAVRDDFSFIILDRLLGMMIAFMGITLELARWKLFLYAFLLFHLLNFLVPLLRSYKIVALVEDLPAVFGVVGSDVMFGLLVNLFIRFGLFIV